MVSPRNFATCLKSIPQPPQNDNDVSFINYFGKEFVDMLEISSWNTDGTFLKDPSHKLQYKIPTV